MILRRQLYFEKLNTKFILHSSFHCQVHNLLIFATIVGCHVEGNFQFPFLIWTSDRPIYSQLREMRRAAPKVTGLSMQENTISWRQVWGANKFTKKFKTMGCIHFASRALLVCQRSVITSYQLLLCLLIFQLFLTLKMFNLVSLCWNPGSSTVLPRFQ